MCFSLRTNLFYVRVEFGPVRAWGFEWVSSYYRLYSIFFIVNFLLVFSAYGCRLVKLNYVNLDILCNWVILIQYFPLLWDLKIYFVTTIFPSIRPHNGVLSEVPL
jgi:hypothetical protein